MSVGEIKAIALTDLWSANEMAIFQGLWDCWTLSPEPQLVNEAVQGCAAQNGERQIKVSSAVAVRDTACALNDQCHNNRSYDDHEHNPICRVWEESLDPPCMGSY